MNLRRRLIQQLAAASLLGLVCLGMASAQAQDFPSKPLKFVVPFPPGSGTDTSARYFAKKFTEITGQTVVVDNKPGANGFIAVRAVLSAPADGYTVFVGSNSTLAVNVALFKSLPYDPVADFSPLSMLMRSPALLIVPGQGAHKTMSELIGNAKAQPGVLNYGAGSAGSAGAAGGVGFGGVDVGDADLLAVEPEGVAIDHAGLARRSGAQREQGGGRGEQRGHGPLTAARLRSGLFVQSRVLFRFRSD